MTIRGTFDPIDDTSKIQDLRKSVGWNPRSREQWEETLSKSRWVYYLYDDDLLIGMGRVVEDGVMAMMYDLVVRKDFQGHGHGKAIMNALLDKVKKTHEYVQLFCDEENVDYYRRLGFDNSMSIGMTLVIE